MMVRHVFLGVLLASCAFAHGALADEFTVDSKITAATVYNDRADLTRVATLDIPAGKHTLVFTGLPLGLMPDSLRAGGKSVANVTFGAISHKVENHLDYTQPKEKELNAKLFLLDDQRKLFSAEQEALTIGREFLKKIAEQAQLRAGEEIAAMELNPETWGNASDAVSTKMFENLKSSHALDQKIRDTNNEIRKVHDELAQLRTGQKQTYSVEIPLEAQSAAKLTVELNYQMASVSWQPVYDARFDTKTGKLELVQYGSVWQQTGEDWSDVDLTLSTAQPSRGSGLPDLYTHWVDILEMRKAARFSGAADMAASPAYVKSVEMQNEQALERALLPTGSAVMSAPGVGESGPGYVAREKQATFAPAQINAEGFIGEYKIVGKSSVPSDGTQTKLLVGGFETESKSHVQVKPQFSNEAFLVVAAKLKGDAPILPGQVNLFRDGAFIGQSYVPMLRPNDEQELSFGVDDNVTVRRNTLKDESSESGLIAKDSVIERHFTTEIRNLHKTPIEVVVMESTPVSQDERVRVEVLKDKTTAGYESDYKDVKGILRWTQKIEPAQASSVNLGWRVNWPKGENISGL